MNLLRFGVSGMAHLVFPTSFGSFTEAEDRGVPGALAHLISEGRLQLLCVDGFNRQSWYDRRVLIGDRIKRHLRYEQYLMDEVVPVAQKFSSQHRVGVIGFSMGGFHALSLALRYPDRVGSCVTLGGAMQIRRFLGRYHSEPAYLLNPPEYLPNLHDDWYLQRYRGMRWSFAVGEADRLVGENREVARLLREKGVPDPLDVWGHGADHDWPWWLEMAKKHVAA